MWIFYWNCKGIGNAASQHTLYSLYKFHRPYVLCHAKPMMEFDAISSCYWSFLNLHLVTTNYKESTVPSIWILASHVISAFNIISNNMQQVIVEFKLNDVLQTITFVYAHVLYSCKCSLWDFLYHMYSSNIHAWCILGDFNAIMGANENTPPQRIAYYEF